MLISLSMLSCDFSRIGYETKRMTEAKADYIHLDVMDGHFVPNLTFGAPVIKAIRNYTDLPFDVHLMISDPLRYAADFAEAGADIITFHIESVSDAAATVKKIKELGKKAGIAVKPATAIESVYPYLDDLDMVVIMTVEPGFGGQKFMDAMMPKVTALKKEIARRGLNTLIELDGGIKNSTALIAHRAGADICVAGTAVFSAENALTAVAQLKGCTEL